MAGLCASLAMGREYKLVEESALPKNALPAPMTVFNFDQERPGPPPPRFTIAALGEAPEAQWEIKEARDAPSRPHVLAQSGSANPGDHAAIVLLAESRLEHGEVAVFFKTLSTDDDQTIGILYLYEDSKNYLALEASSREDACTLYRVKRGKRKIVDRRGVIITPYTWHDLRMVFTHQNYTVVLDKQLVMGGATKGHVRPGQLGIFTKANSKAVFDNLRISREAFVGPSQQ